MASLRRFSMTANHSGTMVSMPGWKGPTVPEMRPRGREWEKDGMMEMGVSCARNELMEMDRVGERGWEPKKEMLGDADDVMVVLEPGRYLES